MKSLFILLILITTFYKSPSNVYICGSGKVDKYHLKENCRGLSNCQYKVVKTTLEKVKKDKKTLCKWEE